MKRFVYKAKEQSTGKIIKGTIQAETERIAGKLLVDRGYVPESLKEEGQGFGDKLNRVTAKDRINFTRQFATLVGAGLPIAQSLRTVSEQTQNKAMKSIVEEILAEIDPERKPLTDDVIEQVNINIKYDGYIKRQIKQVETFRKIENKKIPAEIDYDDVSSLRLEARAKLKAFKPISVGQASRISGVSPADISVLLIYLETYYQKKNENKEQ